MCMSRGETDHPLGQRTKAKSSVVDPGGDERPGGERSLVVEGPAPVFIPSTIKKKSQFRLLFSVRSAFTFLRAV